MWEQIKDRGQRWGDNVQMSSSRLKVPNGWIVRSVAASSNGTSTDQVFVADPLHEWKVETQD